MNATQASQVADDRSLIRERLPVLGNGRIALLAVAAIVVVRVHDLYLYPGLFDLLRLVEGGYAPPEALDEYLVEHGADSTPMWEVLFRMVLVVGLMLWWSARIRYWRTVREDAPTVGWGVACWFIPFANWFVPFGHMRQFAAECAVRVPVRLWQIGFVCTQIAGASTTLSKLKISDADSLRRAWFFGVAESLISILTLLAMSWVLIGLSRSARRVARR